MFACDVVNVCKLDVMDALVFAVKHVIYSLYYETGNLVSLY
jgi:hypothetical protein